MTADDSSVSIRTRTSRRVVAVCRVNSILPTLLSVQSEYHPLDPIIPLVMGTDGFSCSLMRGAVLGGSTCLNGKCQAYACSRGYLLVEGLCVSRR